MSKCLALNLVNIQEIHPDKVKFQTESSLKSELWKSAAGVALKDESGYQLIQMVYSQKAGSVQ